MSLDNSLAVLFPEIAKNFSRKNHPLIASDLSGGSGKKVWWDCDKGGIAHTYSMSVFDKTKRGRGCSACSGYVVVTGFNDLASQRPDIAEMYHHELNEIAATKILASAHRKVFWKCLKCDFVWHERVREVTRQDGRATGCPCCGKRATHVGCSDLATTHPQLVLDWGQKNDLAPTDYRRGSRAKVWWNCHKCGYEWLAQIKERAVKSTGCRKCSMNGTSKMEKLFREKFDERLPDNSSLAHEDASSVVGGISGKRCQVDMFFRFKGRDVIVEYDGNLYHSTYFDKNKEQKDIDKTKDLVAAGYTVFRIRENNLFFLYYPESEVFHQINFSYGKGSSSPTANKAGTTVDIILGLLEDS